MQLYRRAPNAYFARFPLGGEGGGGGILTLLSSGYEICSGKFRVQLLVCVLVLVFDSLHMIRPHYMGSQFMED